MVIVDVVTVQFVAELVQTMESVVADVAKASLLVNDAVVTSFGELVEHRLVSLVRAMM